MKHEPFSKDKIHRQTFDDGLGKTFSIEVPVTLEYHWDDYKGGYVECFPKESSQKIEEAIEEAYPGWFHRCVGKNGVKREECPACRRGHRFGAC